MDLQQPIYPSTKLLLEPVTLGGLHLKNSMILAPLTRCRADLKTNVPNDLMKTYYTQRAGFGLIIAEASSVSPLSNTFTGSGNIHTEEQAEEWKKIVDSVHAAGGQIIIQLWHGGRTTSSSQIGGQQPVSASAIAINGTNYYSKERFEVPHALTIEEIKGVVQEFHRSAELAKKAGFDGVELHCANSYLVDQFLKESSNHRTDEYGGSIENRSRLALEILDTLIEVYGAGLVSIRFSPTGRSNDMYDSNPKGIMKYILGEIEKKNIGFVELRRYGFFDQAPEQSTNGRVHPREQLPDFFGELRALYSGNIVGNDGIFFEEAEKLLADKTVQAVSFGTYSIRNPNLPELFKNNLPIETKRDMTTYYTNTADGYLFEEKPVVSHQATDRMVD